MGKVSCFFIGNLGKKAEVRIVGDNKVAQFSVGVTERGYTTKDGKVIEDVTNWMNVVAWRGLAEIVEKYTDKGSKVYIFGKLRNRSYDDNGVKKYITEIIAEEIELLDKKDNNGNGSSAESTGISKENRGVEGTEGTDGIKDDLPF